MADKITDKQYKKIAKAFVDGGYTPKKAFKAMKKADWQVTVKGEAYGPVYASRVMALMYESGKSGKGVEL